MSYSASAEHILAVIPGSHEHERIVFVSRTSNSEKPIQLRRESFSSDVGWFEQSSLDMSREEMVALRAAMGGSMPSACQTTKLRAASASRADNAQVLSFEAARAATA